MDALYLALAVIGLAGLVALVNRLHAKGGLHPEGGRALVHVLVGISCAVAPLAFSTPWPAIVLAGAFMPLNFVATRRGWLRGMHGVGRTSDGTATFPLALIVASWWCWGLSPERIPVLQAAFLVLAISDPLAGWAGRRSGHWGAYSLGAERKSLAGSFSFLGSAFPLVLAVLWLTPWGQFLSIGERLFLAFAAAAVATVAEAVGRAGWDNLWIVLSVCVVLTVGVEVPGALPALGGAATVGILVAIVTERARLLDRGGAFAAGLLTLSVLWLGGWAWLLPGAVFFLLSSALGRFGRARRATADARAAKTGPRDAVQVGANGGAAWIVLLLATMVPAIPLESAFIVFCAAFAAAAADTWSTEIGTLSSSAPRMITTGRRVPAGTSGAVSPAGLVAAVGGAASVALAGWAVGLQALWVVIAAGTAGALVDSVLGATLQARWRSADGNLVERVPKGVPTRPERGWGWMTNDTVNLICTVSGAILATAFLALSS